MMQLSFCFCSHHDQLNSLAPAVISSNRNSLSLAKKDKGLSIATTNQPSLIRHCEPLNMQSRECSARITILYTGHNWQPTWQSGVDLLEQRKGLLGGLPPQRQ